MIFIAVAEEENITKAAKKLGYSQSTVSFQIRQLEEMLNVRLLERINHTVALTEAGRKVLNYAHRLEQLTVDMEKELRPQPSVSGHVRMALADSLACWILREHYENFRAAYPGITLKMATASTDIKDLHCQIPEPGVPPGRTGPDARPSDGGSSSPFLSGEMER